MHYISRKAINIVCYDFVPSNTILLFEEIKKFVDNGSFEKIYSLEKLEEKMIEKKVDIIFINLSYKLPTRGFSFEDTINRIKKIEPKCKVCLLKPNIGALQKSLFLQNGFDWVICKKNGFEEIKPIITTILEKEFIEIEK